MKFISPESGELTNDEKGNIQQDILLSVYDKDYPVGNTTKAIEQIRSGIQKVLFWSDSLDVLKQGTGGTISLVKDETKGNSTFEMCRAGSNINNGGGYKAVFELYNCFLNSNFNQLFATPRNCLDRENEEGKKIPGGKAISLIYSRLKDVKFWGIAPWYIMPGNTMELLDLRIFTKNDLVRERLTKGDKLYIFSDKYKSVYEEMIDNNYGIENVISSLGKLSKQKKIGEYNFFIEYDDNEHTSNYTYSSVKVSNKGEHSIDMIETILSTLKSKVSIFKLNLFDSSNVLLQEYLDTHGYVLVSLFPESNQMIGYFVKSENKKYALPYYYGEDQLSRDMDIQAKIINLFISS
ncbi:hypothetical protein A9Q91_02135 [Candidatus Gracilibacteria bacterium 28_42_T64]|nr:hypothetical protein A9Q91_02135 [Candidatus Gracilibacteria bacterium 28_42_T64]